VNTGPRLPGDRTICCGEKVIYQGGRGVCPWCQQWVDPVPDPNTKTASQ
jgi:hypothetical protein